VSKRVAYALCHFMNDLGLDESEVRIAKAQLLAGKSVHGHHLVELKGS